MSYTVASAQKGAKCARHVSIVAKKPDVSGRQWFFSGKGPWIFFPYPSHIYPQAERKS